MSHDVVMAEHVIPLDLAIAWQPNAPEAVLLSSDAGKACLALASFDEDPRPVVLLWTGCLAAVMQPPNDEAISGHRLYDRGLHGLRWAGEVVESDWIAELEKANRVHSQHDSARFEGLRHFILPLKECVVEAVAAGAVLVRSEGSTSQAAHAGLAL